MKTLGHHAAIATQIDAINSRVSALASSFANVEQRTAADDALIDILSAQAGGLLQAAQALKQIDYTPPAPEVPE
ncbi:MAG: hypothetical protein VKK63_12055 [Synechococcus sp.]|nr:hypothetical protein [Synechococcus sp.]